MEKDYLKIVDDFLNKQENETGEIIPLIKKYDKFILPNQECYANLMMSKSFVMDDKSIYCDFLKLLDEKKHGEGIMGTLLTVDEFVNNFFGLARDEKGRIELNNSLNYKHSINEYKQKDVAMCFERAVMVHNLLLLSGQKSSLILNDSHAYNIIEGPKSYMLYDITNFSTSIDKDNNVRYPSFMIVPKEEFEDFLYGEKQLELNKEKLEYYYPNVKLDVPKMVYKCLNLKKKTEEDILGV